MSTVEIARPGTLVRPREREEAVGLSAAGPLLVAALALPLAARLDLLSDAGLLASAAIAIQSGQYRLAHSYIVQAIKRDPNDVQAWQRLALVDVALRSPRGTYDAIQRVLELDPKGRESKTLTSQAELLLTPPSESATSRRSSLPAG